jgi:hypothetical protein
VSSDGGVHWTVEPVDTYVSLASFAPMSVHISAAGIIAIGAERNYLVHRRLPLGG